MSNRINKLAPDQSSVDQTAIMSALQVSKRLGALPESDPQESGITLAAGRTYRFYESQSVNLPEITEAMDGSKITIIQLSGSCTINFVDTEPRSHTIRASDNALGGVVIIFVAVYDVDVNKKTWYIDTDSSKQIVTSFGLGSPISTKIDSYLLQGSENGLTGYVDSTSLIINDGGDKFPIFSNLIVSPGTTELWSDIFPIVVPDDCVKTIIEVSGFDALAGVDSDPATQENKGFGRVVIDWEERTVVGIFSYQYGDTKTNHLHARMNGSFAVTSLVEAENNGVEVIPVGLIPSIDLTYHNITKLPMYPRRASDSQVVNYQITHIREVPVTITPDFDVVHISGFSYDVVNTTRISALTSCVLSINPGESGVWISDPDSFYNFDWSDVFSALTIPNNIKKTLIRGRHTLFGQTNISGDAEVGEINVVIDWIDRTVTGSWKFIGGSGLSNIEGGYLITTPIPGDGGDILFDWNFGDSSNKRGVPIIAISNRSITKLPIVDGSLYHTFEIVHVKDTVLNTNYDMIVGIVNDAGTKLVGDNRWTCSFVSTGKYNLNIQESGNYLVQVSPVHFPNQAVEAGYIVSAKHNLTTTGYFANNVNENIVTTLHTSNPHQMSYSSKPWMFVAYRIR